MNTDEVEGRGASPDDLERQRAAVARGYVVDTGRGLSDACEQGHPVFTGGCDACAARAVAHFDAAQSGRGTSRSTARRLERTPGVGCWECSQKNGHAATGGKHMPFHCKPDRCPDKAKHADQVYGGRFEKRLTSASRDGVITTAFIDGEKADRKHRQSRCICGLLLIWTPR